MAIHYPTYYQKRNGARISNRTNAYMGLFRSANNDILWSCMNRLAAEENFEMAILYRDELIRRGVLKLIKGS